jgi:benzodiazapine receptor
MPVPSTLLSAVPSLPTNILRSPALSILLPITCGTLIGYTTNKLSNTKNIYKTLRQPPFNPPAWLFGPVWTILYGMMGYSSYSVSLKTPIPSKYSAIYSLNLALNFLWMPLFFGLKRPAAALVDMGLLTAVTGVMVKWWGEVDQKAGWMLWPYLGWLGYAGYINAGVGMLNGWDIKGTLKRAEKKE